MHEEDNKIIGHILLSRLKVLKESPKHVDHHEVQCGFGNGRGCTDGTFTIKSLITKLQGERTQPRNLDSLPRFAGHGF